MSNPSSRKASTQWKCHLPLLAESGDTVCVLAEGSIFTTISSHRKPVVFDQLVREQLYHLRHGQKAKTIVFC